MQHLLDRVKTLLGGASPSTPETGPEAAQVACAALLLQMASADFEADPVELQLVERTLHRLLHPTDPTEIERLVDQARQRAEDSVSLYDFTAVIHRDWELEAKTALVRELWSVAFADGAIDPKEELLVRKVAGLLHLPHPDFIAAKQAARERHLAGGDFGDGTGDRR
ncbi:MAG: TerB family tellurite resistance protein [Acidobacteria bacterium]|nr:MAG: TerB family tellurite resistance protein [Acidobacteriota bacterium]REK00110.1 MAG: TerB family tellurite resistance protein [Acidobacteriota bacterium]